jgi:hypothetical protein
MLRLVDESATLGRYPALDDMLPRTVVQMLRAPCAVCDDVVC